ncbi:4-hydroxyphenylpyruvate 3-dimethylallyltransferase protein [Rutstroemia sp. NJR-2017a WRK4]|nr:4-hydroxyphenylpyruvate 3-dimethylallyltransferase protein [Rutstroemia sp. NJR-2017a WRK4]
MPTILPPHRNLTLSLQIRPIPLPHRPHPPLHHPLYPPLPPLHPTHPAHLHHRLPLLFHSLALYIKTQFPVQLPLLPLRPHRHPHPRSHLLSPPPSPHTPSSPTSQILDRAILRTSSIQSCDFDAATGGLAKTWLFLRGVRDLGDILGGEAVPEVMKGWKSRFENVGLDKVRHLAVDWIGGTVNLYFLVPGPFSLEQVSSHLSLLSRGAPSQEIIQELEKLLPKQGYTFAVTLDVGTGEVMRVAYYVMGIPEGRMPDLGEWMRGFGEGARSWDREGLEGLVWSFRREGNGKGDCWKWERSYCGELRGF